MPGRVCIILDVLKDLLNIRHSSLTKLVKAQQLVDATIVSDEVHIVSEFHDQAKVFLLDLYPLLPYLQCLLKRS